MVHSDFLFPTLLLVMQLLGILGVVLIRLVDHRKYLQICYALFMFWMAATGLGAVLVSHQGSQHWLPLATTLVVMALGATIDFGRDRASQPF